MKAWAVCESDAERFDVYNGLLLSALWDAAFDRHLLKRIAAEPIHVRRRDARHIKTIEHVG